MAPPYRVPPPHGHCPWKIPIPRPSNDDLLLLTPNPPAQFAAGYLTVVKPGRSCIGTAKGSFYPRYVKFSSTAAVVSTPRHPKATSARVLLTSVFGPFAQDDEFGSRKINPMELYHNQVTRAQGAFSLRMFHRSWGIMLIRENILSPCTLLDFPTREKYEQELRTGNYDVIGISSIIVNVGKVREMCRIARRVAPQATIVVGGHVAAIPGLQHMIDADDIIPGDGVAWMRSFLGQDTTEPVKHPAIVSGFGLRVMGINAASSEGGTAATIIPSAGCPLGCNFCTTSAFFGGKGKFLNFYETGSELFDVMCEMERRLKVQSFFLMDENFLLHRKRAMELLELMQKHDKSWSFYVFSSANAIRKYTMEELVQLGISWVWMGLESPHGNYAKLKGTDTRALVRELRRHGIRLLGSTIIGLEHHTRENLPGEIEYAISHDTDFHQFMLYTPIPGTPLYAELTAAGKMLPDSDLADIHGQFKFNFKHAALERDESKQWLDHAFLRDFERNGPSLYRICRTMFTGWMNHRDHPDGRVRRRFEFEVRQLRVIYPALLWAMERRLRGLNRRVALRVRVLRRRITREFGLPARAATLLGPLLLWTAHREERRLARGWTYEPKPIIEYRGGLS